MSIKDKFIDFINKCINEKSSLKVSFDDEDMIFNPEELHMFKICVKCYYCEDLTQGSKRRIISYGRVKGEKQNGLCFKNNNGKDRNK